MNNEELKQKVERAIGDEFVKWLNRITGSDFQFDSIGADPPDLGYRDGDNIMPVEVATSYYDEEDAKMRWGHARALLEAPTNSGIVHEEGQRLIADINQRIIKKCRGRHEPTTYASSIFTAVANATKLA